MSDQKPSAPPRIDEPTGELAALRDRVEELEQLVARQEQREEEHRLLSENMSDMVATCGPDMNFSYASPSYERVLGYAPEELIGKPIVDGVHPEDLAAIITIMRSYDGSPKVARAEFRRKHKDGRLLWLETQGHTISDDDGRVIGAIFNTWEITDRKQAEEERQRFAERAQQTQKLEALGRLAGGIAHDFNNLLTGVLGNASMALAEIADSEARASILEIEEAAQRASDLARQMLAYSGRGRFQVSKLDLSTVIEEMEHLLGAALSKRATVHLELGKDAPPIEADASQVRQIVMSLATNAAEALGEREGAITIRTGEEVLGDGRHDSWTLEHLAAGRYAFLEVCDDGCGMDLATQEKIFEPFFSTKFVGRGLGLAAVQGIVRGHRGSVHVESRQGEGTTVKVLLPASRPATGQRAAAQADAKGHRVILVVDDEAAVAKLAKRILEKEGFEVLLATDGVEAVELFEGHAETIAAVLLDLTMPRMDGEQTLAELRRIKSDTPVILSSGYGEREATMSFSAGSLAGFLQKPFSPSTLIASIREALEE